MVEHRSLEPDVESSSLSFSVITYLFPFLYNPVLVRFISNLTGAYWFVASPLYDHSLGYNPIFVECTTETHAYGPVAYRNTEPGA